MINKKLLKIIEQLRKDIPDWDMIMPSAQKAIAEWILEDRDANISSV